MTITAPFDDNRETAIDILDGSFARLSNNLLSLGIAVGKAILFINEYPDIIELIQSCISDKIIELENQLKEL